MKEKEPKLDTGVLEDLIHKTHILKTSALYTADKAMLQYVLQSGLDKEGKDSFTAEEVRKLIKAEEGRVI